MGASKKTFDDLANLEIEGVEKRVNTIKREIRKTQKQMKNLNNKESELYDDLRNAEKALRSTERQAATLKRSVWSSKDPNIIDLRNQLLLAAKLIKD